MIGCVNEITNTVGIQTLFVPSGEFFMGSVDRWENERPRHLVKITRPFFLGIAPITQEEYERVTGSNPSGFRGEATLPVESVSWEEAALFCTLLSGLPEERAAGRGYRLPTESEWEYACRAGSITVWHFGDEPALLDDYAWNENTADGRTHPVRLRRPNQWGFHDMHGNVWEWCADWHGEYPEGEVSDPKGPPTGTARTIRGGGCKYGWADNCSSAHRYHLPPVYRTNCLGFRIACDLYEAGRGAER